MTVPTDFVVENAVPGAYLRTPVAIAFLPDGRMLVAEKRGFVWAVKDGLLAPTPMWFNGNEVLDNYDRGLLDIAVDPNFTVNHYLYLLYTVDPDSNLVHDNTAAFGRLTRYQVGFVDSDHVDLSTRTVLLGRSWRDGIPSGSPSHTVGSLRFARDGTLLVSAGEGAQFAVPDPGGLDPGLFLPGRCDSAEDIGAFRARYVGSLAGKILRIDPATGLGLASNPFFDGDPASNRSRVWAYGLRNPFRFTLRPGTGSTDPALGNPGTIYLGDVGWTTWEEVDVARTGGSNFGWPCMEGFEPNLPYQVLTPARSGCDSLATYFNPSPDTPPIAAWNHTDPSLGTPPGFTGNASVGGTFYTGTLYPPHDRGRYFFADYPQGWIRSMETDSTDHLISVEDFGTEMDAPVDLETDPVTGDIVYVAIYSSEVRRIRYVGTENNTPPVAIASAAPSAGPAPLTVRFSAAASHDPEGDPLSYSWLFGDGSGSAERDPRHTYALQGIYQAVLSVNDGRGGIGRDTLTIVADITDFPTTPVLDHFNRPAGALGSSWTDQLDSLTISAGAVTATGTFVDALWDSAAFGPDQEAYVTIAGESLVPGAGHDLLLKVQGSSWQDGCIRVRFDAAADEVTIWTYTHDEGWQPSSDPYPTILLPGDRLGARAFPGGDVQVFRSGEGVAEGSVAGTPFASVGGRIGFMLEKASGARLDDFGGGDYTSPNTPPEITITNPADHSFYAAGDTLLLRCKVTDLQDSAWAMSYHWNMDLHHNNHIHPASFVSDSAAAQFIAANHDDGTGVWMAVSVSVTDRGGLSDTAHVSLYPEIDLTPSIAGTSPHQPGGYVPATFSFEIHNRGRMPAPRSRWRMTAGAALLAEGDTLVAARDSVLVTRTLTPYLKPGAYPLHVAVDTLGAVTETNETNNGSLVTMIVLEGPGSDDFPPVFVSGPTAAPTGVTAHILWKTNEPTTGLLRWGPSAALEDSVTSGADSVHVAILEGLEIGAMYYFRVAATDLAGNVTVAALDSFTTVTGTLGAAGPPLRFALSQARPNPSAGRVAFALDLPHRARIETRLVDVAGREVWRSPAHEMEAGRWTLEWPGGATARPGLYLARMMVDGKAYVRRVVVLR